MRRLNASTALGLLVSLCLAPDALAQQAAPASGPAAPAADAPDVVVVVGQRAAQLRGIEQQRDADNFIEALSGDDAGKLPDGNVAEAVKRLPGVSVANDQGEGRYVIIRGANPAWANVTVNGQTAAAPEPEGRQVKLDDIPSALIGSVVLTESLTPDLDANAIAGQININTVSAFDRTGDFYQARAAVGQTDLNDEKLPYEADLTGGLRFGANNEFGVVAAANFSHRPIRSDNLQASDSWKTINGVAVPNDYRPRRYSLARERTGAVLNFDWRPTDDFRGYVRTTYSKFTDHENRDQFRIEIPQNALANLSASGGDFVNARASRFIRNRNEDDNTFNSTVGGQWNFGESKLKIEGGYTRAEKTDPLRSEFVFQGKADAATGVSGHLDLTDERYLVVPNAAGLANLNNPAGFLFKSVNYDHREAVETLWQGKVDYETPLGFGDNSKLAFGAKITDRDKTNDRNIQAYGPASSSGNFSLTGLTGISDYTIYDGRYAFGPTVAYNLAQAYVAANPGKLKLDSEGSITDSLAEDYEVKERIAAAYVMATLKFGKLTVIPGARVENTDSDYKGYSFNPDDATPQSFNASGGDSYTDLFPSLNVRYDASDNLLFRAAVTTAIGRPDYAQLPPFISVAEGDNEVSLGNPDLKPLKAVNYDLGLSWYPWEGAVVSIGAFEKLIDSPIYTAGSIQSGTFAGTSLTDALVTQPQNAASARIRGVDFNVQMQFTMLPEGLDGLGVALTYTHTDGEARGVQRTAPDGSDPAVYDTTPLFFQSPDVGTAQIFYEKYGVTARIAYSYRSEYLDTVGGSAAEDQYTDSNGQLDVRAAYDINGHIQIFAEGSNLNDATWRRYEGVKHQTIEEERYSWTARIGAAVKY